MKALIAVLILAVALPAVGADPDLETGIALVKEGDFEAAVLRLDAAVRRLEAAGPARELARAYLYLGIAYLELDQELVARGKFGEAAARDPELRLDPGEFSPQVIRTFEAARQERAAEAAPLAGAPKTQPRPAASPLPQQRKKRSAVPFVILGGGAAAAGVALAGGGGGPGAPGTTTTLATTTTTSTTSTTTTSTTVPTGACSYEMSPALQNFDKDGGTGVCQVRTRRDCAWTAESTESWIVITGGESGRGNGTVRFTVRENNDDNARRGRIRLREDHSVRCEIAQAGEGFRLSAATLTWSSELQVPGGRGQAVLNGRVGAFHGPGRSEALGAALPGVSRIEAVLLAAEGKPGLWQFRLAGAFAPGTLRVVAGEVAALTADGIAFRLQGRSGERVVFSFRTGQ